MNGPVKKQIRFVLEVDNEIHRNDKTNLNGRFKEAVELDEWLGNMIELNK